MRTGGGQRAFVHHVLLPVVLLTVALLGGLRVVAGTGAFLFVAPPLVPTPEVRTTNPGRFRDSLPSP